jgi:hypothetical protein
MDVRIDVFRRIELNDPIDGGEVETASGDVGGEEDGVFRGEEALVDFESLHLLLLAVHVHEGNTRTHVAEVFVDESDLRAEQVRKGRGRKRWKKRRTCLPLDRKTIVFVNKCVLMKLHSMSSFVGKSTTM